MPHKQTTTAMIICLALILYAVLTEMSGRPALPGHHGAYWVIVIERFSAYGLLGAVLAFLLPGRVAVACMMAASVAIIFELLQALNPEHTVVLFDVFQKLAGGITGAVVTQAALAFLPRSNS